MGWRQKEGGGFSRSPNDIFASETNNKQPAGHNWQAVLHFPQKISIGNFCNLVFVKTASSLPTSDSPSFQFLSPISHIKVLENVLKHGVGRKIFTDYQP
jgi:hypothetical protein